MAVISKLEKVKKNMHEGVDWSHLEVTYAKNTIYTGYHSWKDYAQVEYTKLQSDLGNTRSQLKTENDALRSTVSSREAEERRLEVTHEEVAKTDQELAVKKRELEEVTTRKNRLDEGLVALQTRGVNIDSVETLVATDASSLDDFRERAKNWHSAP